MDSGSAICAVLRCGRPICEVFASRGMIGSEPVLPPCWNEEDDLQFRQGCFCKDGRARLIVRSPEACSRYARPAGYSFPAECGMLELRICRIRRPLRQRPHLRGGHSKAATRLACIQSQQIGVTGDVVNGCSLPVISETAFWTTVPLVSASERASSMAASTLRAPTTLDFTDAVSPSTAAAVCSSCSVL